MWANGNVKSRNLTLLCDTAFPWVPVFPFLLLKSHNHSAAPLASAPPFTNPLLNPQVSTSTPLPPPPQPLRQPSTRICCKNVLSSCLTSTHIHTCMQTHRHAHSQPSFPSSSPVRPEWIGAAEDDSVASPQGLSRAPHYQDVSSHVALIS